ncbi:hypothetical protein [Salinispora arenicola]|uniref:hypothetical protein n=1 Tax=Salinispora arenicola TaxID=168697 RepID=UPI00037F1AC3|nr:hypothetical protein [Salinispora arenicola]
MTRRTPFGTYTDVYLTSHWWTGPDAECRSAHHAKQVVDRVLAAARTTGRGTSSCGSPRRRLQKLGRDQVVLTRREGSGQVVLGDGDPGRDARPGSSRR